MVSVYPEAIPSEVALTGEQASLGERIGKERHLATQREPHADLHRQGEAFHVRQALATIAVHAALGRPWQGPFDSAFEVCSVDAPHKKMLVEGEDANDVIHILVYCEGTRARILGWCHGYEGKQRGQVWQSGSGRTCYYLAREELRPLSGLGEALRLQERMKSSPLDDEDADVRPAHLPQGFLRRWLKR